jgi:hypothetical protein
VTWTRAAACWLVAVVLAVAYLAGEPSRAPEVGPAQAVAPTPVPAAERAYTLDATALRTVELRRGDESVLLERHDGGWAVKHPTDRTIPGGLVQAFVDQLVDGGEGERVAEESRNPAFGFAAPQLRVIATDAAGKPFTLVVGAATPTGTAAYGRIEEEGAVVLVGRNLLYYADLLLG